MAKPQRPLYLAFRVSALLVYVCSCLPLSIAIPGGVQNIPGAQRNPELIGLAKFAVQQHNSQTHDRLKFVALLSAKDQVVAGILYYLDLKAASDGGQTKLYEAKVWVKSWENFTSLESFKQITTSASSSDTEAAKSDANGAEGEQGFHEVSVSSEYVKQAADEAVKVIQQRSNSLEPYKLKEILSAHVQAADGATNFKLSLKVSWGSKVELFMANVSCTADGVWTVGRTDHLHQ